MAARRRKRDPRSRRCRRSWRHGWRSIADRRRRVVAGSHRRGLLRFQRGAADDRRRRSAGELFRPARRHRPHPWDDVISKVLWAHARRLDVDRRRHQRGHAAMDGRSAERPLADRRDRRHAEHRAARRAGAQRVPRPAAGERLAAGAAPALSSPSAQSASARRRRSTTRCSRTSHFETAGVSYIVINSATMFDTFANTLVSILKGNTASLAMRRQGTMAGSGSGRAGASGRRSIRAARRLPAAVGSSASRGTRPGSVPAGSQPRSHSDVRARRRRRPRSSHSTSHPEMSAPGTCA